MKKENSMNGETVSVIRIRGKSAKERGINPLQLEAWKQNENPKEDRNVRNRNVRKNELLATSTEQSRKLQSKTRMKINEIAEETIDTIVNAVSTLELSVSDIEVCHAREQTSKEWLSKHDLVQEKLTIKDLFEKGVLLGDSSAHNDDTEYEATMRMKQFKIAEEDLNEFELNLHKFIGKLQQRMSWLFSGSRKTFGLVRGLNVCVMIDCSDVNMCYGRYEYLRQTLLNLFEEQLFHKSKLQLISFNKRVHCAWHSPKSLNDLVKPEAVQWIQSLSPSVGCNLMEAFKLCFKQKPIDSIILILGSSPDQHTKLITDYVREQLSGRDVYVHTVNFNCNLFNTKELLSDIANENSGRYHCFSAENQNAEMESTDIRLLSDKMKRAVDVLSNLKELKDGLAIDNKMVICRKGQQDIVESHFYKVHTEEMKKCLEEYQQISIEHTCAQIRPSADWLKTHGLKAKGLSMYQVMAPNAYSYVDGYVASLNKQVISRVHHQSMVQMEWHDGSVKNVHVDPVILFNYQNQLQTALSAYERRVNWLNENSQRCFGTIVQERVVFVVDLCSDSQLGLGELQLAFKSLLEQQLNGKEAFNIICICNEVKIFNESMVKPTSNNISAAWRWFSQMTCSGARKCLGSFRRVFEYVNREDGCDSVLDKEGIYFIATGAPDEPEEVVNAFIHEQLCGTDVSFNCIYFQSLIARQHYMTNDYETEHASTYLRKLSHENNGRFHWVDSQMIVESDDIRLIQLEMSKANNYLVKSKMLFERLREKKHEFNKTKTEAGSKEDITKKTGIKRMTNRPTSSQKVEINSPKHTSLSLARLEIAARPKSATTSSSISSKTVHEKKKPVSTKLPNTNKKKNSPPVLPWRPSTAYARSLIPSVPNRVPGRTYKESIEVQVTQEPTTRVFYTEVGNETGTMFYPNPRSESQGDTKSKPKILKHEELTSSKEWLSNYGLSQVNMGRFVPNDNRNNVDFKNNKSHGPSSATLINKAIRHWTITQTELKTFEREMERVIKLCTKRLKWLLKGSHLLFGTLLENDVIVLIDTSGSMVQHAEELKSHLQQLVWQQMHKRKKRFNMIGYSSNVTIWKDNLVKGSSKDICDEAVDWIKCLKCEGGTNTLEALNYAFNFPEVQGIYLLSDGKPDTSTTKVLREAANLNSTRNVPIHTISYYCDDSEANTFLKMLATQSNGRFHKFQTQDTPEEVKNTDVVGEKRPCQNSSIDESDDVRLIMKEIQSSKKILQQLKSIVVNNIEEKRLFKEKGQTDIKAKHDQAVLVQTTHKL